MPEASQARPTGKVPLRERLLLAWDRALEWMHVYLAFDVQPRRRAPVDIREVDTPGKVARGAERVDGGRSTTWRSGNEPVARTLGTFAVGSRVADTYDVLRVVATGDISNVYLVRHRYWNIDLAVRVPNPQLASIAGALRPFIARAEQWIALGLHPNVATCYHVHSFNGLPLIVAEFVEGVTLREWLATDLEDRFRQGLDVAIQVCHALEHAHSRGIAHGSCTPDAIIIARGCVPKLLNFGVPLSGVQPVHSGTIRLAMSERDVGETYALATLMRTAAYVAPERWRKPTVIAPQGDVFTVGVCLWEIFGGVRPYDSTAIEMQPAIRALDLGADDARRRLATLLQRCVAWSAANRPSGVQEIRDELSAIYEMFFQEPHVARSPAATEADQLNAAAVTSFYSGRLAEAEHAWDAALELDADHLDSLFNRAVARWRHGAETDEELIRKLEGIVVPRTASWKLRCMVGLIHRERGDLESAEAFFEQALRERPEEMEVREALEGVRLRASTTQRTALVAKQSGLVSTVDVSADGNTALAACQDATATVWDLVSGERVQVLEGHSGAVTVAVLSADGRAALTGGEDGTIRMWDLTSGACQRIFAAASGRIVSLSVSPDGRLLLWAARRSSEQIEGSTMQLSDTHTGECVRVFEGYDGPIKSVFLSADGRYAVAGGDDRLVRLWDVETGVCINTFAGHDHFVSKVCMSADGELILSASWDMTLRLWNRHSRRCVRVFSGHSALVASACMSADAVWAASAGWDGTVRLWEVTGRCLRTIHASGGLVTAVALSANGNRLVSGSWDGTIQGWDVSPELREPCRLRTASN